ncbi:MAG: zinc ribbon domain-containing protein [Planctomycetota bacterium]|nr:zinc ribbon domain-containing protein [Planctomycetota bacterium]
MPIYEYTCKSCKGNFEKLIRSMSSAHEAACPKCGSKETARTLSVFAVGTEGTRTGGPSEPGMCGRCGGPGPCGAN